MAADIEEPHMGKPEQPENHVSWWTKHEEKFCKIVILGAVTITWLAIAIVIAAAVIKVVGVV